MAEPKKPARAIADVAHPGKSAPSDTSKPIITHRPMMKDPMVVEDGIDKSEDTAKKPLSKRSSEVKLTPTAASSTPPADTADPADPADSAETAADDTPPTEAKPETKPEPKPDDAGDKTEPANEPVPDEPVPDKPGADEPADNDKKSKAKQPDPGAETAVQAEQDAKLQKIIDSKQFFLPINAVEQRRSKRIVALGVILAILLALAWADIALDAGLIHLGGLHSVTHFFSN